MTRPKILFIAKGLPYPAPAGSGQRSTILIDALAQVGDVSLFIFGPPHRKAFLESAGYHVAATAESTAQNKSRIGRVLLQLFPNIGVNLWRALAGVKVDFTPDPGLSEVLAQTLKREHFDLVVGRYLIPSAQTGILDLQYPPVIIDVDDIDSKSIAAKIHSPTSGLLLRLILKSRFGNVKRLEKILLGKAARLWFSNPDNLSFAIGNNADVIPNIPFEMPPRNQLEHSQPESKTILWVGSFNHRVNFKGVELFLHHAWENILHVNPGVRFRIVGSHLLDALRRKCSVIPGVGFAESLLQHYAEAACSIVPLMDEVLGLKLKYSNRSPI